RLNPKRFVSYTQQQGLSHNNIISVMEGTNALWAGTWGGGLNRFVNGKFSVFNKSGEPTELVLALHEDKKTNLWFGTDFDGGLFRLTVGTNNTFAHYAKKEGLTE